MKSQKIGKHPSTWFLRGRIQKILKVQGSPESGLLNLLKSALGNKVCTEGVETKFVRGKQITSGLSGLARFTDYQGCEFQPPCNVDPEMDCRVARSVYEVECVNCLEHQDGP